MLRLNIRNDQIHFIDIKPQMLPQVLKWYNNVDEFKYATGIDKPIDLGSMIQKYEEVAICSSEFFVGIHDNERQDMIGILKGRVRGGKIPVVWISSIVIDPELQRKGYGSQALHMLLAYLKQTGHIKGAYIAVVEDNIGGMRFWNRNGFQFVRKIEKHMTIDNKKQNVVIMRKRI